MKEDSLNTHPSSPVVLDENESSPVSRNKKQKTNHKRESEKDKGEKEDKKEKEDKERGAGVPVEEGEDTMQFMKEIGWITKGAEAKPPATTTTTTTSNNNNSTSNPNNNNSNMNVQAGNASGPGDVKSSASHANKSHHAPAAHTHHHAYADSHDAIASSSPPRKSRPAQQQQSPKQPSARTQPQHTPHHAPPHHQQPMQHITAKAHHGPNSGHSGAPLPNFAAFDYSSAPNFGMASHPMNVPNPGQFFNPYNNSVRILLSSPLSFSSLSSPLSLMLFPLLSLLIVTIDRVIPVTSEPKHQQHPPNPSSLHHLTSIHPSPTTAWCRREIKIREIRKFKNQNSRKSKIRKFEIQKFHKQHQQQIHKQFVVQQLPQHTKNRRQ